MIIFPFFSLILIIFLLMGMMAKARPVGRVAMPGKMLKTVPLGFLQKIMLHRSSLWALAFGMVWGMASGWLHPALAGLVLMMALMILFFPMKYTFTSKGVAVGDGIFREWNEFSGISRQGAQIVLHHPSFFGRLILFTRSAEADGLFSSLQPHIKSPSYPKGAEAK